jgi:hypothetical protein
MDGKRWRVGFPDGLKLSTDCRVGFIAQPQLHFFLKPTVTREAAHRYGVELPYASRPSWPIYRGMLEFVDEVRAEIRDLRPRDMIDLQSFLWVQGSDEYAD